MRIKDFLGEGVMPEEVSVSDGNLETEEMTMTDEQKKELIKQKCNFFLTYKMNTHISTIRNGLRYFYNGTIEKVSENYIVIKDRKLGLMMISYLEIWDIQKMYPEKYPDKNGK